MFTFAIGISCGNTPFVQKHESTTHVNGFVFDSIFSVGKYFVRTFHVLTVSASQNQTYKGLKKNGINKGINPLAIINAGKKPPTPATASVSQKDNTSQYVKEHFTVKTKKRVRELARNPFVYSDNLKLFFRNFYSFSFCINSYNISFTFFK